MEALFIYHSQESSQKATIIHAHDMTIKPKEGII